MSIGDGLAVRPARDYGEAYARFAALEALDDARISAAGRSRLYSHGKRTAHAVVLLHGLTNAPEQWAAFAAPLHLRGYTVVVPRFPGHGYVDRNTHAIAKIRGTDLLATASDAVDIACGAGERVTLAGLSIGGSIAAWLALRRPDLTQTIAISPFIGIARCDEFVNRLLTTILRTVPNAFLPWDPGGNNAQIPPYAYPKFPTRVLGACLGIGLDALRLAKRRVPAGRLTLTLNGHEPACNNRLAENLASRLLAQRPASAQVIVWDDLPAIHDIIDPTNPLGRPDLVYPRLAALID